MLPQSFYKNRIIQISDLHPIRNDFVNQSHYFEFMTTTKVRDCFRGINGFWKGNEI